MFTMIQRCSLKRGGICSFTHVPVTYNIHILKVSVVAIKGLVRWQSHFPWPFFFLFMCYDFFGLFRQVKVYLID